MWRQSGAVMFSAGLARISLLQHMDLPCRSPKLCRLGAAPQNAQHLEKITQAGGSDTTLPTNELCYFNQRAKAISWEQMFASAFSKPLLHVCYDLRE